MNSNTLGDKILEAIDADILRLKQEEENMSKYDFEDAKAAVKEG